MRVSRMLAAASATLVSLCFATVASATIMGDLKTSSGNGVTTFTLGTITFNPNTAGTPNTGPWNAEVSNTTALTFMGCNGVLGSVGCLDSGGFMPSEAVELANNNTIALTGGLAPNNPFIQFAGNGTAHATLQYFIAAFGNGSPNTNCASLANPGDSCSLYAGSPVILTLTATGTNVAVAMSGTATDGFGASTWIGQFVTPVSGMSPRDIQLYFCPSGTCQTEDFSSGRSIVKPSEGDFLASSSSGVPEPGTIVLTLIGGGLIAFASVRNRRRK
jgi:hypothetical protein